MPITAEDFTVVSQSAGDIYDLNHAINYIQTAMPYNGAPVIDALVNSGVKIEINHDGINNYDHDSKTMKWDPNSALVVIDDDGKPVGVNSSALTFLHEAAHATDEDFLVDNTRITQSSRMTQSVMLSR